MASEVRTLEAFMVRCSECDDMFAKVPPQEYGSRVRKLRPEYSSLREAEAVMEAHNERWHREEAGG